MLRFILNGFSRIVGRLADPRMRILVASNFDTLGRRITYLMRKELEPIRYTGALERSVKHDVNMWRMEVRIAPAAKHTPYVYHGTRPHWVPISVLKPWAAKKLGSASLAYPVQRGIARHGTSVWAARKYGTRGGNPFPERTLKRGDTQEAIRSTAHRLGLNLVAHVEGKSLRR